MIPRDVVLIGVPTNSSGTADGVARAPGVLRQRGLAPALAGRPGRSPGRALGRRRRSDRAPGSGRLRRDATA
jgi:hypothetical protein